mgnify:CR=1 FL=1
MRFYRCNAKDFRRFAAINIQYRYLSHILQAFGTIFWSTFDNFYIELARPFSKLACEKYGQEPIWLVELKWKNKPCAKKTQKSGNS